MRQAAHGLSRREFFRRTAGGSGLSIAAAQALRAQAPAWTGSGGKKGQTYPDQRTRVKDPESGRTVVKLTNVKPSGARAGKFHMYARSATPDSRYVHYISNRSGGEGKFDVFKMDLRSGESVQLTDSGLVRNGTPTLSRDGRLVYFFEAGTTNIRCVNTETFEEREIVRLPERVQKDRSGAIEVSPDGKYLIFGRNLEPPDTQYRYNFSEVALRNAILKVDTASGKVDFLLEGLVPMEHVHVSPVDPNVIMISYEGGNWAWCQHTWLMRIEGTNVKDVMKVFPQSNGEGVGHELFGKSGRTLYAGAWGGRFPQGMWAVNIDGTNERCILAGSTCAHNAVSPQEDRFVVDERYGWGDKLWMAKKGSFEPEVLCRMAANWMGRAKNIIQPANSHPDIEFLENGQGVLFTSDSELYLVEI